MEETPKQQLLRRAATLLGRELLAVQLKVKVTQLDAWMNGQAPMPDGKLIQLSEILDKYARE